jgi:Concanavalin A-like lectin/glucanases superfamily/Carboxypeptidase regulatory-like domain
MPVTDSISNPLAIPRRLTLIVLLLGAWVGFAQPTTPDQVLELDGTEGYVELPPDIFNHLDNATIEAWVRWDDMWGSFKRVFNYGDAYRDLSLTTLLGSSSLWFVISDGTPSEAGLHQIAVTNIIQLHEWCHVAAVSGKGGMRLYFNGALVGRTSFKGSFSGLGSGKRFYFGLGVTQEEPPANFKGAIDEVRVWSVCRTEAEIQSTMFQRLTGKEPGLAGLWSFDGVQDGIVKDLSPGAHHGKLVGRARVIRSLLPTREGLKRPCVIEGTVSDAWGRPVSGAAVIVGQGRTEVAQARTDVGGQYRLAFLERGGPLAITAWGGKGNAGLWNQALSPGAHRINLRLLETVALRGEVKALDDTTPLSGVVVQVLKPGAVPSADPPQWQPDERVVDSVGTDARGVFEFRLLEPGVYELRALRPGGALYYTNGVTVNNPMQEALPLRCNSAWPHSRKAAGKPTSRPKGSRETRLGRCDWGRTVVCGQPPGRERPCLMGIVFRTSQHPPACWAA